MENPKSLIIIGGGIAGLSAGCYARMNGYDTTIFEMHDKPGGLCTAWKRKGYTFDGCIHWLVGSGPGDSFYTVWQELGALQGKKVLDFDEFLRFEGSDGKTFIVYTNLDRLQDHMLEVAPVDKELTKEFIQACRKIVGLEIPLEKPPELMRMKDGIKLMSEMKSVMPVMKKWGSVCLGDFSKRFKTPVLQEAFIHIFFPPMSVFSLMATLVWMHRKTAGYPIGGSLEFARGIEKRYLDLGGEISYKSTVDKILVEDDKAVGIRLVDGTEHRADYVISAADGHTTIFSMLEGRYVNRKIKGYYENFPLFPSMIYVSLGINRSFEDEPHSQSFPPDKPIIIEGNENHRLGFRIYNFDPTLAPEGKTSLITSFSGDYDYWKDLRDNDPDRYNAEKEKTANQVIDRLEKRYPGIADQVEVTDVATPATFKRFTGNWQGTFEGWMPTTRNWRERIPKTLPGLGNFWMGGQWTQIGGGLPNAAIAGRHLIQLICHKDEKEFVAAMS